MKRFALYISFAVALLFSFTGCTEVPDDIFDEHEVVLTEGGKATFTFTPDFLQTPETKALGKLPDVKNIYFAVFDAAGYKLSEYAEAVPNSYATTNWNPDNPSSSDVYSYSVELTITDQPRIIHIIANAPESLPYGTEDEVIGALYTTLDAPETAKKADGTTFTGTDRKDAYWCRLYLKDGVWAEPDPATATSDPDYTTKYTKYMGVVNKLKEAKLVRNFTQLTMTNYDDNHFQLTGFWLTNVPDLGSVAPYNRNTRKFVENFNEYDNVDDLRGTGAGQGNYQGFFPANASLVSIAGTAGWQSAPVPATSALGKTKTAVGTSLTDQHNGSSAYCYEREIPKSDPLYIIVEGKYRVNSTDSWPTNPTYYKIDLKDANNVYFPIIRNFNYRINISEVHRAGAATVEGALSAAPSGDIDTSLDMLGLTNISDGVSQIFVSETEAVLVGSNNIPLFYKYIPDLDVKVSGEPVVVNTPADSLTSAQLAEVRSWTTDTGASAITTLWNSLSQSQRMTLWEELSPMVKTHVDAVFTAANANWKGTGTDQFPYLKSAASGPSKYVTISRVPGETGPVFRGQEVKGTDETDKYRQITLKPVATSAVIKTETVTITGHYWTLVGGVYKESAMSRIVTYRLREKLTMTVRTNPTKVPAAKGESIDVEIGLEAGLPSSIFSLNMDIEALGLSLTADNKKAGNDLPVNSGPSTISGNSKPGYWFTRTITWTEYENAPVVDGKKWFAASFKTSKALAPGTSDDIYVSNKYYNQANTSYSAYDPLEFSNARFTGALAVGTDVAFSFDMEAFSGSSYTVLVAMKGIEPASSETKLTYVGTSDGMEIYSMTVTSNTGNSLTLAPYKAGNDAVEVKLMADEYTPVSVKGSPLASPIYLYADIAHDNATAIDHVALNGTDVTGAGQLVVGQTGKLTIYVSESATSIQLAPNGGSGTALTANRVTTGAGATVTIDGKTYYAYTTNNNYTATAKTGTGGAGYDEIVVRYNGSPVGSVMIPIYGVQLGTNLTSVSFSTSAYYIIKNYNTGRYIYNANALLKDSYDYSSLVKFGSTTSTSTVAFVSETTQYYLGSSGNTNVSRRTTSYGWTIDSNSTHHERMRFSRNGSRFIYDNGSDMSISNTGTTNNNRYWIIYPVNFVAPPAI